jgi:tetratricopeptide (TPR) repeat protein
VESARESLVSARKIAPHRHDILSLLVDVEFQAGRLTEARRALVEAQTQYPTAARLYRKLAEIDALSGNSGLAAAVLGAGAARSESQAAELFGEAARMRERRGEYGQALLDYRAMLRASEPAQAAVMRESYWSHLTHLELLVRGSPNVNGQRADPQHRRKHPAPVPSSSPSLLLKQEDDAGDTGLIITGGIELLARTVGFDPSQLTGPQGAERLFHYLLQATPPDSNKLRDNPRRNEVVTYLKNYRALMKHLQKQSAFFRFLASRLRSVSRRTVPRKLS